MGNLTIACVFAMLMFVIANEDLELSNAANEGDLALVSKALASGANPNWQSPGGSWPMVTALIRASAKNYVQIVLALLNAGADPNLQEYRGITALNEAAYHGSVDVVPILISHGADVNAYGWNTPLLRTIHLNQVDIARVLLYHGADPNQKDKQGRTVADHARKRGHNELANLIENFDTLSVTAVNSFSIDKLSSPNAFSVTTTPIDSTINISSPTASQTNKDIQLFNATKDGYLPLVTKALASGANFNWQNPAMNGKTALMIASHRNDAEIVLAILAAGADPNLQDNSGNGPIHQASYYGSAEVLPILISHGADVNLQNNDEFTPLHKTAHIECAGHWIETAQILLQNGADPNLKERHGRTAANLASSRGFIKLANFIDNFDMTTVTAEPYVSTPKLRPSVSVTPTSSKVKLSSLTASQVFISSTISFIEVDSPTTLLDQRTPTITPTQQSSIASSTSHNLVLRLQITMTCVALASIIVLMY